MAYEQKEKNKTSNFDEINVLSHCCNSEVRIQSLNGIAMVWRIGKMRDVAKLTIYDPLSVDEKSASERYRPWTPRKSTYLEENQTHQWNSVGWRTELMALVRSTDYWNSVALVRRIGRCPSYVEVKYRMAVFSSVTLNRFGHTAMVRFLSYLSLRFVWSLSRCIAVYVLLAPEKGGCGCSESAYLPDWFITHTPNEVSDASRMWLWSRSSVSDWTRLLTSMSERMPLIISRRRNLDQHETPSVRENITV